MDIVIIVLAAICVIAGLLGSVVPVLPGAPLSWLGLLILKFVPSVKEGISWRVIIILGVITIGIVLLNHFLPILGTKKAGGNNVVMWGAAIGLIIGIFFGIFGVIFGPFLGAFIASFLIDMRLGPALKQASGALVGFLLGIVLELITCGIITVFFISSLFQK